MRNSKLYFYKTSASKDFATGFYNFNVLSCFLDASFYLIRVCRESVATLNRLLFSVNTKL